MNKFEANKDTVILLFSTLIIALCGLLYELLIGSTSSYLMGSSVKQFSFTIGAFMTSFGIGSYLSKYILKNVMRNFLIVETIIGFLGSICILSLFYFYSASDIYYIVMYFFIVSIGVLVGLEIPLIGRIIDDIKKDIRITLANLLCFDYIGGMIASIIFPLLLLPWLGLVKSSIAIGIGNLLIAVLVGFRFRRQIAKKLVLIPIILIILDVFLLIKAKEIQIYIEQRYYSDTIIYLKQSPYQRIVLTQDGEDLRLFLDGNIQFSSVDESRYHEAITHIPISVRGNAKKLRVLILGGGDGLAAREFLKYPEIESITICDLDREITQLSGTYPLITKLNENALSHAKVKIINADAFTLLQNNMIEYKRNPSLKKYDIIVADLPDPNNESLAKLYTVKFYKLINANLNDDGIAVTQAASPFHSRNVFWCIYSTIKHSGFTGALPYHVNVPSFGIWGFIIFSKNNISIPEKLLLSSDRLKFLNEAILKSFFIFPKDMEYVNVKINTIFQPVILDYYEKSWQRY